MYFQDDSLNIGCGPISVKFGTTIIINVVDQYIAVYTHKGGGTGVSAIPSSCSKTSGSVAGDMSNPENYSGLFLERSFTSIFLTAGDAYSIERGTYNLGRVSQGGAGTEINWSIGATVSDYKLTETYYFN